ncbi:MAG: hypothetical protein CBB68_00515 [Rhodospirillaceae bacterium TMED8]|nr:hypothetical protein [Magnetovibrio sp.]OUT53368.1 MAG: hypothetical protein CBB68_00515 [Rhodospirillaceae bacterium TMED8]
MTFTSNKYPNADLSRPTQLLAEKLDVYERVIIDTLQAELFANSHIPRAKHFDPYFVNLTKDALLT